MRVFFSNLGCKLNQAELESLARQFHGAGHHVVASLDDADFHVINSCTVTHVAARSSRKMVRRGKLNRPHLRTVLTGCFASEGEVFEEADLVVPNDRKDSLLALVHEAFPETVPDATSETAPNLVPVPYVPLEFGNTRALIKVEDGCNMRCSFCIIPFTRGRQRSRSVEDCVAELQGFEEAGYQEVVVTGVQISAYRSGKDRLYELVKALLEETSIPRLRLTSIAPWQLDRRLLELWNGGRLCRHIHMSLQSGCTATLARMRRAYTAEDYAAVVAEVREAIPGLAVTTDVIVGFPGETEEEFKDSLGFVESMGFAKTHVFPYSSRRGTLAADLPGNVEAGISKERVGRMKTVAEAGERAFLRSHLGSCETVLWEGERNGVWQGLTDNYVRVFGRHHAPLANRLIPTRLEAMVDGGVQGAPLVPS